MDISLTELFQILDNRYLYVPALLAEREKLKQEILDLVAHDAALQAKVAAALKRSDEVEAKARGGLPVSPATP